ncbi:MAG: hypothetical protein KME29_19080 [Calothrix sp. FI2-JRJ7]|jgi:hypothetical protein|nr:hypothetical protein [Calothrix sp. FI2-JRJ7]
MKPSLSSDFTVSVRHQSWEEPPEVAEFYQGIYSVTLNFLVNVMFVPEFEINVNNSLIFPENIDNVSSEAEARLFTLCFSDYTITPNSLKKGQQEIITLASAAENSKDTNLISDVRVIFYVSPEEFALFSKELSPLAEQTSGVHDYVKISEIENLKFAKYILSSVISSSCFQEKDKKILARDTKVSIAR